MPFLNDKDRADIERAREIREAVRAAKEETTRQEQKEKGRERSRSKPGDPLILRIDKYLDRWRW